MFFLIQKDHENLSLDNIILFKLIQQEKYLHTYEMIDNKEFFYIDENEEQQLRKKNTFPMEYQNAIPLGTIEFTQNYFKIFYGIEKENPIKIPSILRTEEFLKRKYSIISSDKIPKNGYFFIKDVSQLKVFSYTGDMGLFMYDEIFDKPKKNDYSLHLNKKHLYQVSEVVKILSEYRIFVINNEIYSINNYDGDVRLFPDIKLIEKSILLWSTQKNCPKSYSLDVAITPRGTIILECHILFSTGIYSTVQGTKFLWGYQDAKDYLVNYNTQFTEFSNFE